TGKSTLLKERFNQKKTLSLDLLDSSLEDRFFRNPSELYPIVKGLSGEVTHVIIDEIQKVPALLDEVHRLIEETDKVFILTGSSARKLKHGGANLLAGRAFVYHLYPLSCFELKEQFDLENALRWGTLPKIFKFDESSEKEEFLRAYGDTYLKEEIWNEQVIRKLPPFRRFLEVASQVNGKIINYANIARDVGVDDKTIKEYFCVLEDTMIGFFLEPFHNSFRKRLVGKPKFYFFDTGIVRALSRKLSVPLLPKTSDYGNAFEHFVLLEFIRLASYFQPDYRFSFIRTASDVEVDLVVERPGKRLLCVEIKSTDTIDKRDFNSFFKLTSAMEDCEAVVLSQDRFMKKFDHVTCYPWQQGLVEFFPEVKGFVTTL
ncbi:MAG: ATP-binding protein, partial [Parachlamydiaceae bacterium]|nr:ATP-binding protein [Parachlamydiaceae bacterium]